MKLNFNNNTTHANDTFCFWAIAPNVIFSTVSCYHALISETSNQSINLN